MHDEVVDRVARAIIHMAIARGYSIPATLIRHLAVAAIEAMLEPSEEMVCNGDEQIIAAISDHTFALREPTPAKAAWQAMIDGALVTKPLPEAQKDE